MYLCDAHLGHVFPPTVQPHRIALLHERGCSGVSLPEKHKPFDQKWLRETETPTVHSTWWLRPFLFVSDAVRSAKDLRRIGRP